jgi:hypothetical protein
VGIAVIVSVITRTCAGPISPAASAAAVFGQHRRKDLTGHRAADGELAGVGDASAGLGR